MQVVVSDQKAHKAVSNMLTSAQVQVSKLKAPSPEAAIALNDYGKLPLVFEANQSQTDDQVEFLSRGRGYSLFLTSAEAVLVLNKSSKTRVQSDASQKFAGPQATRATTYDVLRMKLVDANPFLQIVGLEELPGKSNYFSGNDPEKWLTNIPNYRKVIYQQVYSGINLVFYGNQRQLEYDFVVAPGAHPDAIHLTFKGADKLSLDEEGNLLLHMAGGKVIQRAPIVYQEIGGNKQEIAGSYVLNGKDMVGFQVAAYDPTKPLIIDPVLVYSTFLGGYEGEGGWDIAVDASGNAYVTGRTDLTNFPLTNPLQFTYGGSDVFVTKLDPTGSMLYSTFLGGNGFEIGKDIAVDVSGNAYVTGETRSTNFPIKNPFQATHGDGETDAFVAKLNPSGSALVYSTYLGGGGYDQGAGIAADASGNAYVTGATGSPDFPTLNPFQAALEGVTDAFVTKLNPSGSALVYSTFLGGSDCDNFDPSVFFSPFAVTGDIAVDAFGNAYVTGSTCSPDFPTLNPFQAALGGELDAFVTKLNPSGSALVYSTFLGSSRSDKSAGIAVDASGNAYVTGGTNSPDFPTLNPFQAVHKGETDAFVTKLNPSGSALVYSTFLGGDSFENYNMSGLPFSVLGDIAVDASGNAFVTGFTNSPNFPTLNPFQAALDGVTDAFVAKLNPSGSALVYSTFLGGSSVEVGIGIAVDAFGYTYVTGATGSEDFPTKNPLQPIYGGGIDDAFIVKIEN